MHIDMLKLKSVIFLGLFVLLQSCSENEPFNKMKLKNGEIISVDDNSNIEQILEEPLYVANTEKPTIKGNEVPLDTLVGFTKVSCKNEWKRFKVGQWARTYGLLNSDLFYGKWEFYYKEIPCRSNEIVVAYNKINGLVGFLPLGYSDVSSLSKPMVASNPYQRGFSVYHINYGGNVLAYTALLHLKCNKEGDILNFYYPISPEKLTWVIGRVQINKYIGNEL